MPHSVVEAWAPAPGVDFVDIFALPPLWRIGGLAQLAVCVGWLACEQAGAFFKGQGQRTPANSLARSKLYRCSTSMVGSCVSSVPCITVVRGPQQVACCVRCSCRSDDKFVVPLLAFA